MNSKNFDSLNTDSVDYTYQQSEPEYRTWDVNVKTELTTPSDTPMPRINEDE
jgi:hypothetical protein